MEDVHKGKFKVECTCGGEVKLDYRFHPQLLTWKFTCACGKSVSIEERPAFRTTWEIRL